MGNLSTPPATGNDLYEWNRDILAGVVTPFPVNSKFFNDLLAEANRREAEHPDVE